VAQKEKIIKNKLIDQLIEITLLIEGFQEKKGV